jgi:hypothetical protein
LEPVRTGFGKTRRAIAAPLFASRTLGGDGRPVLAQVGYLSTIAEDQLEDAQQRRLFWVRARYRLGLLRLPPNEIKLIERALAERVPPPEQQQAAE